MFNHRTLYIATAILLLFKTNTQAQCTGFDVNITVNSDTVCAGDLIFLAGVPTNSNATIDWRFPSNTVVNNVDTIGTANIQLSDSGRYIAYATWGSCSASDTVYLKIGVRPPSPTMVTNAPLCVGDTLQIEIVPQVNQSWWRYKLEKSPSTYVNNTKVTKLVYTFPTNDFFFGYVSDTNGCISQSTFTPVNVVAKRAKPSATSNSPVCNGSNVELYGSPVLWNSSHQWTDENGSTYTTKDVTIPGPLSHGKYRYVLQTVDSGCLSYPDTIYVDVGAPKTPKASISADPGFNVGPYVPVTYTANVLDTGITVTYQWYKNLVPITNATNKTLQLINTTDILGGEVLFVRINTSPVCALATTVDSPPRAIAINLGIEELINNSLILYPNPVQDILIVSRLNNSDQISVSTITGKQVPISTVIEGDKTIVNTEDLAPGTYLLHNGDNVVKFIKN